MTPRFHRDMLEAQKSSKIIKNLLDQPVAPLCFCKARGGLCSRVANGTKQRPTRIIKDTHPMETRGEIGKIINTSDKQFYNKML